MRTLHCPEGCKMGLRYPPSCIEDWADGRGILSDDKGKPQPFMEDGTRTIIPQGIHEDCLPMCVNCGNDAVWTPL